MPICFWYRPEMRARDALLDAMIPAPGAGLPAMAAIDRSRFWPRFDAAAPLGLRLVFGGVTLWLVYIMPWLLGFWRPWSRLNTEQTDELLLRSSDWPLLGQSLDLVKLIACFAYFDDPGVQATIRAAPP